MDTTRFRVQHSDVSHSVERQAAHAYSLTALVADLSLSEVNTCKYLAAMTVLSLYKSTSVLNPVKDKLY